MINGVAIALAPSIVGRHVGIVHRDGSGSLVFLHLRFDYDLAYEKFDPAAYAWVIADVTATEANLIGSLCRKVYSRNPRGLPYAIKTSATIARTGRVYFGSPGDGFTCATLVLAIFAGAGLLLLDASSWRPRAEDISAQTIAVNLLIQRLANPTHIAIQQANVGVYRFRPEEVAVGAVNAELGPVSFDAVVPLAEALAKEVTAAFARS